MSEIASTKSRKRCAVYCRVSSDERLDQEFNSIDAQKEAGHAFVASQRSEGWIPVADDYDDPGFSGGNTDRPGLKRLMANIERGQIDIVVVYKIDRLTRSLADFAPGTILLREWGEREHRVTVTAEGLFEYQGRNFKSLTAVARHITGAHWSGPLFFGLSKGGAR